MATQQTTKQPYYEKIANQLIEQLKNGTAPWQLPWEPGVPKMPHNPISGSRYRGGNALWLAMQGYGDPRWMTYKQAQGINGQVNKGEKGTLIQYWKLYDRVPKKDQNGNVMTTPEGKKIMVNVQLQRPRVFSAVVFNAQQIEGIPEQEVKVQADWQRHERAEKIIQNFGVPIHHDQHDNAYYSPASDSIHLPDKAQFSTADRYFATVLHETGHASGAASRLDRDMTGRFGDESYAKEELRAEIASLMLGDELQIGHDFGQHAAYVDHWVKALQDDPKEILRASKDAESIQTYLLGFEHEKSHSVVQVKGDERQAESSAQIKNIKQEHDEVEL